MVIQREKGGIKIESGKTDIFLNPDGNAEEGIVILTVPNESFGTSRERLVIEGPGEYEFRGISVKGVRREGIVSYAINSSEGEIYYTTSDGFKFIPEDEPLTAAVVDTTSPLDVSQISKMGYPLILIDSNNFLGNDLEAERVKSVNLNKIAPEEKNVFVL